MQLQPEFKDGICILKSRENADEKRQQLNKELVQAGSWKTRIK
jgi:hypothetical protein